MCGIVGYAGHRQAVDVVLAGLRRLEYRGYDSAGVAVVAGARLVTEKRAGKLGNLIGALGQYPALTGTVGLGHTRWATHGPPPTRTLTRTGTAAAGWRSCTTGSSRTSPPCASRCSRTAMC